MWLRELQNSEQPSENHLDTLNQSLLLCQEAAAHPLRILWVLVTVACGYTCIPYIDRIILPYISTYFETVGKSEKSKSRIIEQWKRNVIQLCYFIFWPLVTPPQKKKLQPGRFNLICSGPDFLLNHLLQQYRKTSKVWLIKILYFW